MKFKPTLTQLETIAELTCARAAPDRIAAALAIPVEVYTTWVSRLAAARLAEQKIDPEAEDRLRNPPIVQPSPEPP